MVVALGSGNAAAQADFQGATHLMPFDEETINYSQKEANGPVAELQKRIDHGEAKLEFDPAHGYLPALLKELGISETSQMLVFSKTSFQRERIFPQTPRALYFADEAYIGYIPGAPLLELTAVDPDLGAVFYTLEQKELERPRLVRTDQCLECHASSKSLGVPGHLVRSFETDASGLVNMGTGISPITHRTPLADRWGGWYVTGTHGQQTHRGNLMGKEAFELQKLEPNHMGNTSKLSGFDHGKYPTGHSDIVALMVLEHQTHMHNFITRLQYASAMALQQYGHVRYLKSVTEAFLKYLLFVDEAPLTSPIQGTSGYAEWFGALGPKDSKGRSLRDFDLQTRMFKYPCSYLIYSEAFDRLPAPIKDRIYERLGQILKGEDTSLEFAALSTGSRQAILEILLDTKPGLPDSWRTKRTE
jgi:hypothetical protein